MRIALLVLTMGLAVSCASQKDVLPQSAPSKSTEPRDTSAPPPTAAKGSVETERRANEGAYLFLYVPAQTRLASTQKGRWLAIAAGRVIPASGTEPAPVATIEEADAAARAAVPNAVHRFVFQVGEEGDVDLSLGGCELQHVLGNSFLALLKRDDVVMKGLGPGERIEARLGDALTEITVKTPDELRMYLRPNVSAPGSQGAASENYCIATGFSGHATMSSASAAGLELWEIPGVAHVKGAALSGDCRRARARFAWTNTPLDFTVPVAIWPK